MMILNLTQHAATPAQTEQGLVDVEDRSALRDLLTIPADALEASDSTLDEYLTGVVGGLLSVFVLPAQATRIKERTPKLTRMSWIDRLNAYRDAGALPILVGGAPILMERLIPALKSAGCVPMHALSARKVVEVTNPDGTVTKRSVFEHIRFKGAV